MLIRFLAWCDRNAGLLAAVAILVLALLMAGCSDPPTPARPVPPAAAEVTDLTAREHAAGLAAAEATAKGDTVEAEYQRRLAAAIAPLRLAAEERQRTQQRDLDQIAAREATAAQAAAEARQMAQDRRRAFWGLGGCIALAVALLWLKAPLLLALGLPSAVAAGLAAVVGLTSVPWLGAALGYGLVCLLLVGLAGLVAYVVREWKRHADDTDREGRPAADAASIARQPRLLRPLITRLLT